MTNPTDATRSQEATEAKPARPTWLPAPCPPWCDWPDIHTEHDHYDDRIHTGAEFEIILTAVDDRHVDQDDDPDTVRAYLRQHYREIGPRIEVSRDEKPVDIQLTPDEAEEFARRLLDQVALARSAGDGTTHPAGCPTWCAEHVEDGHMRTVQAGPGKVHMDRWPDTDVTVSVDIASDRVMSLDEAEELTRALLAVTSAARRNNPIE